MSDPQHPRGGLVSHDLNNDVDVDSATDDNCNDKMLSKYSYLLY